MQFGSGWGKLLNQLKGKSATEIKLFLREKPHAITEIEEGLQMFERRLVMIMNENKSNSDVSNDFDLKAWESYKQDVNLM